MDSIYETREFIPGKLYVVYTYNIDPYLVHNDVPKVMVDIYYTEKEFDGYLVTYHEGVEITYRNLPIEDLEELWRSPRERIPVGDVVMLIKYYPSYSKVLYKGRVGYISTNAYFDRVL
jgi:hypothetical protein